MKLDKKTYSYLENKKFSNGWDFSFSFEKYLSQTRNHFLLKKIKNKRIIHLGFADHIPLIKEKINQKRWLHGLLIENSQKCIGLDINKEAVEYIKKEFSINNIYHIDIEKDDIHPIVNEKFDYLLLGEIIEHIDNPVNFLKTIHQKLKDKTEKIIITAPNVFNLETRRDIRRNKENINTDHRYWFSPFTLSKIATLSEFKEIELEFTEQINLPIKFKIKKMIFKILRRELYLPANCFSSIVLTAKF